MSYQQISHDYSFPKAEERILGYWKKNRTFELSIENRKNSPEFVFYDGPPFANGLPHYGHFLTSFVKDTVARYQTMRGKKVDRRFGWDCHGLPAEMETEKNLGISGRKAIEEFGVDKFNDSCQSSVMKYAKEWEYYVTRAGRWVSFENDYKTMDLPYMESVIWAFASLYKKGLIYEDTRVMPYSWKCETPLSNFETRLDNSYRTKTSKAVTVKFKLNEVPTEVLAKYPEVKSVFMLVWTTTPWTLPSNLALAVGANIDYCVLYGAKKQEAYIVAKELKEKFVKELDLQ